MLFISLFVVVICLTECSGHPGARSFTKSGKTKDKLQSCGFDKLHNRTVREGPANIQMFSWLGLLIYPHDTQEATVTSVVLISKQVALASALDIDHYPKDDFRERSRVVLGSTCTGPFIRIREYTFHHDFSKSTYSALALLQLELSRRTLSIQPICPPPTDLQNTEEVYALTLTKDFYNSTMVRIYRMSYVDMSECIEFYRRAELNVESMWPSHLACVKAHHGGHCIWRSGTALVVRQKGRWRLLGLGTYGPGCESPSRFLDYGMYHDWVKRSISRIGHAAVSNIAPDHIILRRTMTNVQRFGLCDQEEMKYEMFGDRVEIFPKYDIDRSAEFATMNYNVTIIDNVEYQCIVMRVWNIFNATGLPTIGLRRWCTNPTPICAESETTSIYFYVEIKFKHRCVFKISAYGTDRKYIDTKKFLQYYNNKYDQFPQQLPTRR